MLLASRWGLLAALLCIWWWIGEEHWIGVALLLYFAGTILFRMQFSNSFWLVAAEWGICAAACFYWPTAVWWLAVPGLESGWVGKPFWLLMLCFIFLLPVPITIKTGACLVVIGTFWIGHILRTWTHREMEYLHAADRERGHRYELEQLKNQLLSSELRAARLVEANERNRIAQQLHDHVGHEITGALFALQAYRQLLQDHDERSESMLESAISRVESSSVLLRETVYRLKPVSEVGSERLRLLCEHFAYCKVDYRIIGDETVVPATFWTILEPCLKEALTNVLRHSDATYVEVRLDITPYLVRLSVRDNGIGSANVQPGIGVRGIIERVKAGGGTVSIDGQNGFSLISVLPIERTRS